MGGALADVATLVLPTDCRLCGAPLVAEGDSVPLDGGVCRQCLMPPEAGHSDEGNSTNLDLLCSRCGDALAVESARFARSLGLTECMPCRLVPPHFERAVAAATYADQSRELLHLLKFHGVRSLGRRVLGARLAEAILRLEKDAAADLLVVPVPLFAARERRRGFNQATLLAAAALQRLRRLRPQWRLRLETGLLRRVRDTHSLYPLSPRQRRTALQGAFRVTAGAAAALKGREVLLIDDIMTTGATANACARVLRRAGATRVWVATAARARGEGMHATASFSFATAVQPSPH